MVCVVVVSVSMVPGGSVVQSQRRSVPSVDDVGVMGEVGVGRHHGRGLHSGPWPLLSVVCVVVVSVLMVPGGCIRSSCLQRGPSVDDVSMIGEVGTGRHRGRGFHAGPRPLLAESVFCLYLQNNSLKMRSVFTIRLPEEYVGMLENINLELEQSGIIVKDNVLIKTVLLTGIRAINQKFTQGINIFDAGGNED